MRLSFILIIIFIVVSLINISAAGVQQFTSVPVKLISDVWKLVDDTNADVPYKEKIVLENIDFVNIKFDESIRMREIDLAIAKIYGVIRKSFSKVNHMKYFIAIDKYSNFIDNFYHDLQKYVKDFELYEADELVNFANDTVSDHSNSVVSLMTSIYRYTTSNLLNKTSIYFTTGDNIFCNSGLAPQQIFFIFLQKILHIHAKSYITIQSAYIIKQLYTKNNFSTKALDATKEFKRRNSKMVAKVKIYMRDLSKEFWRCDPEHHAPDETYVQLTNLVRGYVINKQLLSPSRQCFDDCKAFSHRKGQIKCDNHEFCKSAQPACSKILECVELATDEAKVCLGTPATRRYHYIAKDNGEMFGQKTQCHHEDLYSVESFRFRILWKCSYCFCLCDEGGRSHSDVFINLRSRIANIADNKVITGVQFVKRNRIIHLQIQEGKLLPHSKIDIDSVRWIPVEDYKISDDDKYEGQDYHTFTWEERAIDLKTIIAKQGSLVTGVRFKRVSKRLTLQVLTTPFNHTTGQLRPAESVFEDSSNNFKYKFDKELKLEKPDIPTRATSQSTPNASDGYIKFTNTDTKKDAAQTTVPFFDAQPVALAVHAPLTGLGIFYKGAKGFGGFLASKIVVYDYNPDLQTIVP